MYEIVIADSGFIDRKFIRKVASEIDGLAVAGECDCGQVAVEACLSLTPRLVVLDCGMGDIDAHEVARRIHRGNRDIVIIMTGWDEDDFYKYGYEADSPFSPGIAEYLLKPIHHLKMRETLLRHLEKNYDSVARDLHERDIRPASGHNAFRREIAAAVEQIDASFREGISLDSVATHISMTSSYFSKLFKQEVGMNFLQYLTKKRLDYAKQMMAEMDRSMLDIAMEAGFREQNYFGKVFKKHTGLTPLEYKKQIRGDHIVDR
jgi:YesN/AraC family two-component response regulator